ncbi:MAG: Divalent-cation tolerance protein CutA [Chlamydiae bacterium]|nr:Divalent-cation tolerance protein CutA [Chlamydiota bacterium]
MAYIQIQWTSDSLNEAKQIAKELVRKKWVAVANILPYVDSFYLMDGKMQEEKEVKVFFKTKDELFAKVRDYIIQHATYDVPEVSKILIADANPDYISWLFEQLAEEESV